VSHKRKIENARMLESISPFSSSGKYPFEVFLGQRKPLDAAKNRLFACGRAKVSQRKFRTPAQARGMPKSQQPTRRLNGARKL
jgi:hypothetical protein